MLRNWLREWLGIEKLDDHVFDHYREIDEMKTEQGWLRSRLDATKDHGGALTGRGVLCPYDGVGAMGFNPTRTAVEDGKSEYYVGQTRTVKVAGSGRGARPVVLEFVGGVLVDRGATVER